MNIRDLEGLWWSLLVLPFLLQLIILRIRFFWQGHQLFGGLTVALYISVLLFTFGVSRPLIVRLITIVPILYLVMNALRWMVGRFDEEYIRNTVVVATVKFSLAAILLFYTTPLFENGRWIVTMSVLCVVDLLIALYILYRMTWAYRHYIVEDANPMYDKGRLPSVTLAIPARNETDALNETLYRAVRSDYPKLEILVLDDCSEDRTAEIIKSFAHDGVRFVQGEIPADGWLGKSKASDTLVKEASGDIIIFAGVDTHIAEQTISRLVAYMQVTKADMVSILPQRRELDFWPLILQPLRDFWQLALPINRRAVPIASQCWAIKTEVLHKLGGFGGVRNTIFPEEHFAKEIVKTGIYRYVISDELLGVTTRKRLSSQVETATRTYYPLLHRRPAFVGAMTAFSTCLLLPYGLFAYLITAHGSGILLTLATLVMLVMLCAQLLALRRLAPRGWLVGIFNFPLVLFFDTLLFNWSMLAYEFAEVNWKGRNVCYPVIPYITPVVFNRLIDDTLGVDDASDGAPQTNKHRHHPHHY
jgi:hypothetical protein